MRITVLAPLLVALALLTGPAHAGGSPSNPAGGDNYLELSPMALPVISGGKVKNYVFIQARLLPGPGADLLRLREYEPYYRDALVRAAHRTHFNGPNDWTALDTQRVQAVLLTEARRISGPRAFSAAQVVRQTPRRRTGMPGTR